MEKQFMYEKIYQDILDKMESGEYPAGARVPSEKELAAEYKVSRITSKKALEMLAEEGRVERFPGKGSFVTDWRKQKEAALPEVLRAEPVGLRRKMIGVIFDSFGVDFGAILLKSIEQECRKRGFTVILYCTYGSIEEENRVIQDAVDLGAEGLILICAQDETYNPAILQLNLNHFPMVLIDRQMQGISISCVKTDNHQAARELTLLLIERGHRQICFLSHSSVGTSTIRERQEGFLSCLAEHDDVKGKVIHVSAYNPTSEDREGDAETLKLDEIRQLLLDHEECTAFLTLDYNLAAHLGRALKDLGMEKEVVSFDGMPEACRSFGIAYVRQGERLMGIRTVERIHQMIAGADEKGNINIPYRVIRCEII